MIKYNKMLNKIGNVKETELFSSNSDTISVIPVKLNETFQCIGIVRGNDKIVYLDRFVLDGASDFFRDCSRYCINNPARSFFSLKNTLLQKTKSDMPEVYKCFYNNSVYTVFSTDPADGKYVFPLADLFDGSVICDRTAALQLFLTLAFSDAVVEAINETLATDPVLVGVLTHDGGNEMLSYVMSSVRGKTSACSVKNPNEISNRIKYNNNFEFVGTGKKTYNFADAINGIFENSIVGTFFFAFPGYAFPFAANKSIFKARMLLIQENFNFTEDDMDLYFSRLDGTDYLSHFKNYIQGKDVAARYDEICKELIKKGVFSNNAATYKKMIHIASVVKLTAELLNSWFSNLAIDVDGVCDLLCEAEETAVKFVSYSADSIFANIISGVDPSEIIAADESQKGKGRLSEGEIAIPKRTVVDFLKKKYPDK